ncbi:hypothetical protein JCM10212_004031 [Sporobolomyces blumeae]
MPMRLPRALRPTSAFFSPSYGTVLSRVSGLTTAPPAPASSLASSSSRPSRRYSCSSSSSGRSSSRDGSSSSSRVKAQAAVARSSSASSTASTSASPAAVSPTALKPAVVKQTPAAYNLPHVSADLVRLDSLFALHRPLLELPVQYHNRRTTSRTESTHALSAAEEMEMRMEETRPLEVVEEVLDSAEGQQTMTVAELSAELAEVVDLSEDGTPLGAPYLARVGPIEPLKSVEEELAAEAKEDESLALHEEKLHDMEKDEAEPYDAWMIGQHEPLPYDVARYLAVRPPHQVPQSSSPAASDSTSSISTKTLSDLTFLSPFSKPAPSSVSPASSSASSASASRVAPPPSPYAPAFSKYFLRPLDPTDASAVADQFLSHHQLVHTWAARTEYAQNAAEALRRAEQTYSDVASPSRDVVESNVAPLARKGTIQYWSEQEGWTSFDLSKGVSSNGSPFLPAEWVDLDAVTGVEDIVVELDSVKRKRKKKITKHKYKKRRKAQRALRQRLGK